LVTNYNCVRKALGDAVEGATQVLNVYSYVPRSLTPPSAIIQPAPRRTIDYLQTQSSGLGKWRFNVLIVVGQVDEESAQEQAGDLISPGSPLLLALNQRLGTGFSQVVEGGISQMMFDQGLYTYAELSVIVTA
jgi:hypothetical protein